MSKTISTRIENNLHERFLNICNLEGVTIAEMMREQIQQVTEAIEQYNQDEKNVDKIFSS